MSEFTGHVRKLSENSGSDSASAAELSSVDAAEPSYRPSSRPSLELENGHGARKSGEAMPGVFDIAAILRLRTFLYLIAGTALLLFQIHNTLTIKTLSRQNEQLREQLRISTSISTAQSLKVNELQSIHNISEQALSLGLSSSAVPPVELAPQQTDNRR